MIKSNKFVQSLFTTPTFYNSKKLNLNLVPKRWLDLVRYFQFDSIFNRINEISLLTFEPGVECWQKVLLLGFLIRCYRIENVLWDLVAFTIILSPEFYSLTCLSAIISLFCASNFSSNFSSESKSLESSESESSESINFQDYFRNFQDWIDIINVWG